MRKVLFSVVISMVLIGCAFNDPNVLVIKPYQPKVATVTKGKSIKKIYIKSIQDLRDEPGILGSYEDSGNLYLVRTKTSMTTWVYDALQRALEYRGYVIVDAPTKGSLNLSISILSVNAQYKDLQNQDNMFGNLLFKVLYQKSIYGQKDSIKLSFRSYYESLPSQSEYEDYVYKMLDRAIDKIIKQANSY